MSRYHEHYEHSSSIDRRIFLKGVVASLAAIAVAETMTSCDNVPEFDANKIAKEITETKRLIHPETNLATDMPWRMIGTEQSAKGLTIHPIYATIEDRETGDYQDNPSIALFGPHFKLPDAWQLTLQINHGDGFSLQCYGRLPLIRDDYRIENDSVRIELNDTDLRIQSWGNDDTALQDEYAPLIENTSERELQLQCDGGQLLVSVDGAVISQFKQRGIFSSGNLWLGFDATSPVRVTDVRLSAAAPIEAYDAMTLHVPQTDDGLHVQTQKINPSLRIGATVAPGPLVENRLYDAIALGGNYGSITLENAMKPVHLMPQPNTPTFEEADAVIELARRHNLDIHGHTLVFGESLPKWMRRLPVNTDTEKSTVRRVMHDYIATIMSHYKGRVKSWDVINEPLAPLEDDTPGWRKHLWYEAMGTRYIEMALQTARRIDPEALLFINENGLENDANTGSKNRWRFLMDKIILPMKAKGLIDGVGMQGHVAELPRDAINPSTLTAHFRELELHGLLGRVSEIDIDTPSEAQRATQYAGALEACLNAKNCIGFTMWGVMSGYENKGLVWDIDGQPQLAVKKMKDTLKR